MNIQNSLKRPVTSDDKLTASEFIRSGFVWMIVFMACFFGFSVVLLGANWLVAEGLLSGVMVDVVSGVLNVLSWVLLGGSLIMVALSGARALYLELREVIWWSN